jgi:hypothetical protein
MFQKISSNRKLLATFGLVSIGVPTFSYVVPVVDDGTKRSIKFWFYAFPIYAHYRTIQLLNRDLNLISNDLADKYYNELHEKYSLTAKQITYELRGFYLKQVFTMIIKM